MRRLPHRARIIAWQQAAAHENAQQPPADLRLHLDDGVGIGELSHTVLLTNLANALQPIIRYDLGDRMRAHIGPCPCGSPLPAFELQGRADDILALRASDGSTVKLPPLAIATIVEDTVRIHRFQIVQDAADRLTLRLLQADRTRGDGALDALREYLADQGLANVTVSLDAMEPRETRDGKLRHVVAMRR